MRPVLIGEDDGEDDNPRMVKMVVRVSWIMRSRESVGEFVALFAGLVK